MKYEVKFLIIVEHEKVDDDDLWLIEYQAVEEAMQRLSTDNILSVEECDE